MASRIFQEITVKRPASVLFPGGQSPLIFYAKLILSTIEWNGISIMASDERIVPMSSSDSNTGMIKRELVDKIKRNQKPELITSFPEYKNNIENALNKISNTLKNKLPDVAFLGMGSDGHTAGIFSVNSKEEYCYCFKNSYEPYQRITVSMNVLINIPHLIFFITGIKKKMLTQVLSKSNETDSTPISFLLLNGCGQKTIICDKQSAPSGYSPGETIIDTSSII